MAIKINTLEMLLEELDQDLQWRKKEILDIRTLIIAKRNSARDEPCLSDIIIIHSPHVEVCCLISLVDKKRK